MFVCLGLVGVVPGCSLVFAGNSDAFTNLLWSSSGKIFFTRLDYGIREGLWVRETDGHLSLLHENGQRLGFCDRADVVDTFAYSSEAIGVTVECMDEGDVQFLAYSMNVGNYNIRPIAYSTGLVSVLPISASTAVGVENILGKNGCQLLYLLNGRSRDPLALRLGSEILGLAKGPDCQLPQFRHEITVSRSASLIGISVSVHSNGHQKVVLNAVNEDRAKVVFDEGDTITDLAFSADGTSLYIGSSTLSEDESRAGIVRVDLKTGGYDWLIRGIDLDGLATSPGNNQWVYTVDGEFVFSA